MVWSFEDINYIDIVPVLLSTNPGMADFCTVIGCRAVELKKTMLALFQKASLCELSVPI